MAKRVVLMPIDTEYQNMEIQATVSARHGLNNTITDFPVESGSVISDNYHTERDTLSLDCFVSDSPQTLGAGRIGQFIEQEAIGEGQKYSIRVWEYLRDLAEDGVLMDVETPVQMYFDMMIETVSQTRTVANAGGIQFSLTLKEIVQVDSETTEAETPDEATTDAAQKQKKKGKKQPKAADTKETEKVQDSSWAVKLFG